MATLVNDLASINVSKKINIADHLVEAARASGCSPFSMAFDYLKLRQKRGKLKFYEYFLYELYNKELWSETEREEFVSAHIHWPLANACNNQNWWAVTEDKWLSDRFLKQNGIPIPETLAVFDTTARRYGETPKLSSAKDLQEFLSNQLFPLFAKPICGIWSAGALRISGHTETHVLLDNEPPITFEEFADTTLKDTPYIFQSCLVSHAFFDGITEAIPTVRCLNIIDDDSLSVPYALLKLPRNGNIADNFWRPGNLLCNLDPETGEVLGIAAVTDGRRQELEALPDAERAFIGETLPFWDDLKKLNAEVSLLHAENHFSSTDIAITKDGPVVVEVNNGCAFELVQIGTGKGFLDAQMTAFFRKHGASI